LAKLKSETERSKSILEKQALAEQKRKQLSYEAAVKAGLQSPPKSPAKMPRSILEPVNKVQPEDKDRQEGCLDLVKRLKKEKKERQRKLEEYQRKQDAKMSAEIEERRKAEADRAHQKQVQVDRRRDEIENMVRVRKENR